MTIEYHEISTTEAYSLQNAGGLILLCTHAPEGRTPHHDLAPIAWVCPYEYQPISKMLAVCDTSHKTFQDVIETREAVLALASTDQKSLCKQTGSASGFKVDKFTDFALPHFFAHSMDIAIPEGVAGWMECRLSEYVIRGTSGILFLDVVKAFAMEDFWRNRLHFVSENIWFKPGALQE